MNIQSTFTITFCDRAENHVGMEQIGQLAEKGFSLSDLEDIQQKLQSVAIDSTIHSLDCDIQPQPDSGIPPAHILIVPHAARSMIPGDPLAELSELDWDIKAVMYGRVVNKRARYNLCFADFNQEPDYANRKGRVINFDHLPVLNQLRYCIYDITGRMMVAEGNYYYDVSKCGIGWHGDAERRLVVGARYGASSKLCFQWYYQGNRMGSRRDFTLNDGDLYIMSEKATGFDWKLRNSYTLRHAAGCDSFLA